MTNESKKSKQFYCSKLSGKIPAQTEVDRANEIVQELHLQRKNF